LGEEELERERESDLERGRRGEGEMMIIMFTKTPG
jgi:hypothetical protein